MASHFGDRLCEAVRKKSTPLIVGIDPVYGRLPESIRSHKDMNDALDLGASIDALFDFCSRVLKVVAPIVPAVKINIAYFEKYLWEFSVVIFVSPETGKFQKELLCQIGIKFPLETEKTLI